MFFEILTFNVLITHFFKKNTLSGFVELMAQTEEGLFLTLSGGIPSLPFKSVALYSVCGHGGDFYIHLSPSSTPHCISFPGLKLQMHG